MPLVHVGGFTGMHDDAWPPHGWPTGGPRLAPWFIQLAGQGLDEWSSEGIVPLCPCTALMCTPYVCTRPVLDGDGCGMRGRAERGNPPAAICIENRGKKGKAREDFQTTHSRGPNRVASTPNRHSSGVATTQNGGLTVRDLLRLSLT